MGGHGHIVTVKAAIWRQSPEKVLGADAAWAEAHPEALDALLRAGIDVPGRVSVVGYDDSPLSRLAHIDLTTVSQESRQLTHHAVAAVVERLDGGRTERREVVVPPRLVVRGTTGPPSSS